MITDEDGLVDPCPSESSSLASKASFASLSHPSISTPRSSIESSEASLLQVSSRVSEDSLKSRHSHNATASLIVRRACRFDCYCSCHSVTIVEEGSATSVEKSFSQLGVSSTLCDDPRCQLGGSTEKAFSSISFFFQKALSHVMSAHSVKVRYHMNTFHMVPESSDIMRFAKQGGLDKLMEAIQSWQATIWDTAPDGWSLLHVRFLH